VFTSIHKEIKSLKSKQEQAYKPQIEFAMKLNGDKHFKKPYKKYSYVKNIDSKSYVIIVVKWDTTHLAVILGKLKFLKKS